MQRAGLTTRGYILYVSEDAGLCGREWFQRTEDEDGRIVVRAVSELDPLDVIRDVTVTVDRDFRPLDCVARVFARGDTGVERFTVDGAAIECEALLAGAHETRRVEVDGGAPFLGPHPLLADAWIVGSTGDEGPGRRTVEGVAAARIGDDEGQVVGPCTLDVEELPRERVETPAGTFETRHFRVRYDGGAQDTWVTDDFVLVRLRDDELGIEGVLQELERC